MERRRRANRLATDIDAVIEARDGVQQANRIDVDDRRGIGIVGDERHVAGDHDDVADAHGMRAEQIGLQAQETSIARRILQDGFDPRPLLDQHGQRQRAETRSGLTVRNDHRVDALDAQAARLLDALVADMASRRDAAPRASPSGGEPARWPDTTSPIDRSA